MEEIVPSSSETAAGEFGTRNGPKPRSAVDKQLRSKRRTQKQIEVCLEGTTEAPWVTAGSLELAVPEVCLSLGRSEGASSAMSAAAHGASTHSPIANDEATTDLSSGGAYLPSQGVTSSVWTKMTRTERKRWQKRQNQVAVGKATESFGKAV